VKRANAPMRPPHLVDASPPHLVDAFSPHMVDASPPHIVDAVLVYYLASGVMGFFVCAVWWCGVVFATSWPGLGFLVVVARGCVDRVVTRDFAFLHTRVGIPHNAKSLICIAMLRIRHSVNVIG
jgi:hypothetical protein